ncbi:MAG: STAS domain-containing protein [Tepidisphaeraceae bacterium]
MSSTGQSESPLLVTEIDGWTVVEFRTASLMDPLQLERIASAIYPLVDAQDKRLVVLDFTVVRYLSSQAIGILLTLKRKLDTVSRSKLVLCGVNDTLMQLLKITRLDRVLTIKPTQREAVKVSTAL